MIFRSLLFIIVIGFTTSLFATIKSTKEADLKAAYIYNFARYTKWENKTAKSKEFLICVHKESDLYESLKKLENKKINNMKIKVLGVSEGKDWLVPCHIAVLPKLSNKRLRALVKKAVASNVLTISEHDGYAQKGVVINLKRVFNKITFEINLDQVKHSKLKMSSNLLKMATIVSNK